MRSRAALSDSTSAIPSLSVEPHEELTSFVFKEDQIVKKTQKIRYNRLMPRRNPETRRLETSVCRSHKMKEARVWEICSEHFDRHAPKSAIGRGVGVAQIVFDNGLHFDADGVPYPEHANVIGWHDVPDIPETEQKHFWMDAAQRMASGFSYKPRVSNEDLA